MWQEARKQEKKIRGMMVDHKKRAERRREYYEKIKQDPAQFLQAYGRPCKIHIDANIAAAADSPANMMPWQGQKDNMIDRFDGRAHLDIIPEYISTSDNSNMSSSEKSKEKREQRALNYERYRILVQNDFLKIPEERFLRTIELEEQFGGKTYQATKAKEDKKKIKKEGKIGAAIGFNYDQDDMQGQDFGNGSFSKNGEPIHSLSITDREASNVGFESENINSVAEDSEDEDSDLDLDLTVDIMALNPEQRTEINSKGKTYGLGKEDFIKSLAKDIEEAAEMKHAKEKEEEKAMFSGRKSRRERRIIREKQLAGRKLSPPSYAVSNTNDKDAKLSCGKDESGSSDSDSDSSKRSSESSDETSSRFERRKRRKHRKLDKRSNQTTSKVEFITTFGGSGPECEGTDDRQNENEKLQAAKRREAQMKLKRLRRNESPPPMIGPLLPSDIVSVPTEKLKEPDKQYPNIKRGNNYRSNNKRHSSSRSPVNDHRYRRRDDDDRDYRRRSRSRGRYSRSPRRNRDYKSRRRSSSRGRSRSPRRRHRQRSRTRSRSRRSRSRSRRSRSRSTNRDSNKMRKNRDRSNERSTCDEHTKTKAKLKSSRSRSPPKRESVKTYSSENGSKSNILSANTAKEEKLSVNEYNKPKAESSSDSSSSEDEAPNKYRSKYRNKRRSSSSSSDGKNDTPAKNANENLSNIKFENTSDSETMYKSMNTSIETPLVKAKKMLAISTAKENEAQMNVDMSRIESTSMDDNTPHIKHEVVDFYGDSNETGRVKAPPPPTIRSRTPDSPPIKRYYKRALRRAGGSSSDEISDGEHEDHRSEKSVGQYSLGGIRSYQEDRNSSSTFSQSQYAGTSTSISRISSNIQPSNSVVLDAKAKAAVKDKIKKRVQAAIKRQFKADQKAEEARKQRNEEERLYREEEMRDMALKLRKREREKACLSSAGDVIPPLMSDWDIRAMDESREYHSGRRRSRSSSKERFDITTYRRSRSGSPKSRSNRKRSKSPYESAFGTSGREDYKSWEVEKRRKKRASRSRSKSPQESKKSNKSKLKLVDY